MNDQPAPTIKQLVLTRGDLNILRCLAKCPDDWTMAAHIPDGNGHTSGGGASGVRLKRLLDDGLIRYGKDPQHSFYGYQITQRGRLYAP
jgi:hypothetical protein